MGFKIAKTTHHMEDELTQTQQQISAIEHELLSVSSRQMKTEKIANELNSRFLHVQSDVQNQRIELEKREDKLKKMKEFLEQNRQQHKVDNKRLYQVISIKIYRFCQSSLLTIGHLDHRSTPSAIFDPWPSFISAIGCF